MKTFSFIILTLYFFFLRAIYMDPTIITGTPQTFFLAILGIVIVPLSFTFALLYRISIRIDEARSGAVLLRKAV